MSPRALPTLLAFAFALPALGEQWPFTGSSGRAMNAALKSADEGTVVIRHKQGNEADTNQAMARREKIADFCRDHRRKQVGNGECWTLANEAFIASGATRPGNDLRVWGRLVDIADEPIEPGDIVEFRAAEIPGYGTTGEKHTAVVIKGGRRGKCTLAEQNWGGAKTVRHIAVNLSALVSGQVMVYRPE